MTDTQLANAALRMLGAARIGELNERSPEAEALRDVWALTRDSLLRSYRWNFAKRSDDLSQDVDGNWVLPSDCLRPLTVNALPLGLRNAPQVFGRVLKFPADSPALLASETVTVTLEYIARVESVADWDASFCLVFQHFLAAQVAPGLSGASGKAADLKQEARAAVNAAIEANAIETAPLVVGAYDNLNVSDTWADAWAADP